MNDVVTILGGGWSASLVDLKALPGFVIGINDSFLYAPCNMVCSMDRKWVEGRWDQLERAPFPVHLRVQATKNIPRPLPPHVFTFSCDHESTYFTDRIFDGLNGTNSGFCGLNLAYLRLKSSPLGLRKMIFLVGFDMRDGPKGERHWYPDYDWGRGKVKGDWAKQFGDAYDCCKSAGIEVFTVGTWSRVPNFPRVRPENFSCET